MQVIIGIDPHKASHTAVAVSGDEDELAGLRSARAVDSSTSCCPGRLRSRRGRGRSRAPKGSGSSSRSSS
jgi:hypothetical protein